MEKINLKDGDGLKILPETKDFLFGCCDCGLVHKIKVQRKEDNIILRFFRINKCIDCKNILSNYEKKKNGNLCLKCWSNG